MSTVEPTVINETRKNGTNVLWTFTPTEQNEGQGQGKLYKWSMTVSRPGSDQSEVKAMDNLASEADIEALRDEVQSGAHDYSDWASEGELPPAVVCRKTW